MALIDLVQSKVKDDSGRLTDADDYAPAIAAALLKYSTHRPRDLVVDVVGGGTHDVALPDAWVEEFSQVRRVEYPVDIVPETLLEGFRIYQSPDGPVLRLSDDEPAASEMVRLTITVPRQESQIVTGDLDAVANLAASFCCDTLANLFAATCDPTISADVVNYRSKSTEYSKRAKDLRKLYLDHIGTDEEGGAPAAMTMAPPPPVTGRLTH